MKTFIHSQPLNGFSTIEILITFAVGIVFLTAAMLVAFSDPTLARSISLDSGQAATLDIALDSTALATSTNNISSTTAKLLKNWNASISSIAQTGTNPYAITPTIVDIAPCFKTISNETGWSRSFGNRSHTMTFGTGLANLNIARALGRDGCDPTPPGDWGNPQNPNWQTSPSAIDGTQSGLAAATINGTPYVFITTTNTTQKKDIWVINVTNTASPSVVNSLETGDNSHKNGLNDIAVVTTSAGTYGYVLQNTTDNQLQTINLSNPTGSLSVANTISFVPYGVTTAGTNPQGKVITYNNGRLYIGLYTTIGPELLVFDVKNNPAAPQYVGSINAGFDHSINDIVINGNYAYLAIKPGSPPTGNTTKELMIINVSGSTPVDTGNGFNANTGANDTEAATTLYHIGSKLYMGREKVSAAAERDFYVFDISNPTTPTVLKSKTMTTIGSGGSMGTPRIIDLIVQGKIGFFVTTDSTAPFQIFDVVSNSSDIVPISNCTNSLNLPKLTEIAYRNGFIYGVNGNQAALNILRNNPNACTL